jgi:hypothetical protein
MKQTTEWEKKSLPLIIWQGINVRTGGMAQDRAFAQQAQILEFHLWYHQKGVYIQNI